MTPVRRVVTGHRLDGTSTVASETTLEWSTMAESGAAQITVWGSDAPPTFPDNGTEPHLATGLPLPGGARFLLFTFPPAGTGRLDRITDVLTHRTSGREVSEPRIPTMHRTATADLIYVIQGVLALELDDRTVVLRRGDTLVQNGTRHDWTSVGEEPVLLASFVVGARTDLAHLAG